MGGSDPLSQCQDLCALLAATNGSLEAMLPPLRAQEQGLAGLVPSLREELTAARNEVDALETEIETAGERVVQALRGLEQEATDQQEAVSGLEGSVAEAEESASRELDEKARMLESHFEELGTEAFTRLEDDLAREQSDFSLAWSAVEADLGALHESFAAAEQSIDSELDLTEAEFDQTKDRLDEVASDLAGATVDGSPVSWLLEFKVTEDVVEHLEQHGETAVESMAAWEHRLDAEAALLHSSAESLAEGVGNAVLDGARQLAEGIEPFDRGMEAVRIEVAQAEADLEAARPALDEAGALAARIAPTEERIKWIREVVAAMDTK